MKTKEINKKKFIKALFILIGISVVALAVGFGIGIMSGVIEDFDFSTLKEFAKSILIYVTPAVLFAVTVFVTVFTLVTYSKSKKAFNHWDGEDEESIENTERLIDIAVAVLTVGFIVYLILLGVWSYTVNSLMDKETFLAMFPVTLAVYIVFIGDMIFSIAMQRACVQLVTKINPEKRGEVLALNFQKEWEQSLDEAQKLMTFEAGYRTFKLMNYIFIIAWIICVMGTYFGLGLAPVIFVSLLWLAMTITYVVYGYKIEHKSKNKKR